MNISDISDINKYYLINWFKYYDKNDFKLKELFALISEDDQFVEINSSDTKEIIQFIKDNYEIGYTLIFPIYSQDFKGNSLNDFCNQAKRLHHEIYKILNFIFTIDKNIFKMNLIIPLRDVWKGPRPIRTKIQNLLYKQIRNCYVLTPTIVDKAFNQFIMNDDENKSLSLKQKEQIIDRSRSFPTFYCYKMYKFNNDVINKIAVSGQRKSSKYPERANLPKYNTDVIVLSYNMGERISNDSTGYLNRLHKYKCCFASNHRKIRGSPVLKFYEILSTGSLLLCSNKDMKSHEAIGLENRINCIIINFDDVEELQNTLNYILEPSNVEEINKIRRNGHELARTIYTANNRYNQFKQLLNNIINIKG